MKIAIHQPNFIPWFPYFYKIQKADVFVVMINCQFEKNGYQNRANVFGEWWTQPVKSGKEPIKDKHYVNGEGLLDVNMLWILAICKTLGIDTKKIHFDFETEKGGTDRIIEICKRFECDQYLTNPEATEKYLDAKLMNENGIEIVPCETSYKKHIFEMFKDFGIEGTVKILRKDFSPCTI